MARRRGRLTGGRLWRDRAGYSPWYPRKDLVWRQLRPTVDASACLIESQPTESGLLFGVAWSRTDRLTYEVNGTAVPHGHKAFVDPALARALVQWRTGPCPAHQEAPE